MISNIRVNFEWSFDNFVQVHAMISIRQFNYTQFRAVQLVAYMGAVIFKKYTWILCFALSDVFALDNSSPRYRFFHRLRTRTVNEVWQPLHQSEDSAWRNRETRQFHRHPPDAHANHCQRRFWKQRSHIKTHRKHGQDTHTAEVEM